VLYESIIALAVSIIATSATLVGHIRRQAIAGNIDDMNR
jgi:hypothetical protein